MGKFALFWALGFVALAALQGASATCPTFAAWLRPENEVGMPEHVQNTPTTRV